MMGNQKPDWLETLCNQKFFAPCSIHEIAKKNEMNICCLDCCTCICPHCVQYHRFHRLLQIRRYVYHDVVRLEDMEKLIDCSNVQAYTINGAKVVFIRKRPQNRQFKGSGNYCTSCDRSLQEPFYHCSLGCKVEFVLKQYKDLSPFLRICNSLPLGPEFFIPQDAMGDDDHNDSPHSTVVDSDDQLMMSYYSSSGNNSSSGSENMVSSSVFCMAEFVRKKRSGVVYVCGRSPSSTTKKQQQQQLVSEEDMATSMSRRKGTPQRSPMC